MVLKITPRQRTKINALVRRSCCNCYKGNCLLLDDGEEAKCTQLISQYGGLSFSHQCESIYYAISMTEKILCYYRIIERYLHIHYANSMPNSTLPAN